ncbi:hypothetical protein GCM10027341_16070 [Spirosoma knui]
MNTLKTRLLFVVSLLVLTQACTNDEENVAPTQDNEAITTVTLNLTNQAVPTETVTATIDNLTTQADLSKATLTLKANTTYTGSITLLDKTKTPVLDVTAGIRTEANEHLFVYTPSSGLALAVTITDKDTNPAPGPYPLGLQTELKTGAAGSGKLKVVLRHQPDVKNGMATPGTSDLDTDFNVVIQ